MFKAYRLPKNWADLLTASEVDAIIKHWQSVVGYWEWQELMLTPNAERDLAIVRSRVTLWKAVLARKQAGLPCQDLIHEALRTATVV